MKPIALITISLLFHSLSFGQSLETDKLSKEKITTLSFLVGEWKGTGWMYGQDRTRHEFEQTENIQFKLDSTTILIEGLGTSNGKIIHNALAIISYNKENDAYNFHSYLANGRKGEFKAELKGDKFYWYPMDNMRYLIEVNDQAQWHETGEYNREGNWYQFFEMTLEKR